MRENAQATRNLRQAATPERVWLTVAGPADFDEGAEIERLSVDLKPADVDFLTRLATYRNALADAQGKKMRRKWTRKSLAESFLSVQCDAMRSQLSEMLAACGELPPPDDGDAVRKYVAKVLAWDKKNSK